MEGAGCSRIGLYGPVGPVDLQAEQLVGRRLLAGAAITVPSENVHRRCVVGRAAVHDEDEAVAR